MLLSYTKFTSVCSLSLCKALAPNNCGLRKTMWYSEKHTNLEIQESRDKNYSPIYASNYFGNKPIFCFHFPHYILHLSLLSHLTNAISSQVLSLCISHFPSGHSPFRADPTSDLHFYFL